MLGRGVSLTLVPRCVWYIEVTGRAGAPKWSKPRALHSWGVLVTGEGRGHVSVVGGRGIQSAGMQQPRSKVSWSAAIFSISHTVLGSLAFIVALLTCLSLHYRRVVRNHVAGYPEEWWPSVSATIGDWFLSAIFSRSSVLLLPDFDLP